MLLWPVYPNIGIDNRNQWDLHRDMPGGVPALRKMVEDFHRRGVRVLFPAMPWDTGTRDPGVPHWTATARLMAEIGADGVNGDTFAGVPRAYRTASDETGHPVAFEPEGAPEADEGLMWNNMNWSNFRFTFAPAVPKQKWLEPRHMINISDRWARDKTDDLQFAFFNGIGYVSWENIWGIWNQITPRDAEALRRVAAIERRFAAHLVSAGWEPHTPTVRYGVFASKFPLAQSTVWTIVNRNEYAVDGQPDRDPDQRWAATITTCGTAWNCSQASPGAAAVLQLRHRRSRLRRGARGRAGRLGVATRSGAGARHASGAAGRSLPIRTNGISCRSRWWKSRPPNPPPARRRAWRKFPPASSISRFRASRSKAPIGKGWTCSIPGSPRRAGTMRTPFPSSAFTSTASR